MSSKRPEPRARRRGAIDVALTALRRAVQLSDPDHRAGRMLATAELAFERGRTGHRDRDAARDRTRGSDTSGGRARALHQRATGCARAGGSRTGGRSDRDRRAGGRGRRSRRSTTTCFGSPPRARGGRARARTFGSSSSTPPIAQDRRPRRIHGWSRSTRMPIRTPTRRRSSRACATQPDSATLDVEARRISDFGRDGHRRLQRQPEVLRDRDRQRPRRGTARATAPPAGDAGDPGGSPASTGTIAIPAAEEACRLATELGQPIWLATAETAVAMIGALRGDPEATDRATARAEQLALPLGATHLVALRPIRAGAVGARAGSPRRGAPARRAAV